MNFLTALLRPVAVPSLGLMLIICANIPGHASSPTSTFTGHYELADAKAKATRSFSLDVRQTNSRAAVSFSAAMADGSGAAPDAEGKGRVSDGVLSFDFTDSFKNEGTCTLQLMKDGYHLSITIIKVIDPAPFHFYGSVLLKKISSVAGQ